jgi:hypothetical protein
MVLSVPQRLHQPAAPSAPVVVLVEGMSDRMALETLAARLDRRLSDEGISILAIGGATNAARFVDRLGPRGLGARLAGLYDAAEERHFTRALERAGFGSGLSGPAIEALGFYACHVDLEDELIRALGLASVEQVVEAAGDLGSLRTFQMQPAQQGRDPERQLRRFMGTRSGRKTQYARLLVNALDLSRVPRPLEAVLSQAGSLAARLTLTSPAPR